MKKNQPIGIFDSGVGGLTVLNEIVKLLPGEDIVYFGDTARVPYGTKSPETVKNFAIENSLFLLEHNVKMIIAACNTVSSVAFPYLVRKVPVPVIDVLKPAVRKAVESSSSGRIGVIGTNATIRSRAYEKQILRLRPKTKVFFQACPLFVPFVEEGFVSGRPLKDIVKIYLKGLKEKNIDTLVLGCTHYPLIKGEISRYMSKKVLLVDSARTAAEDVKEVLKKRGALSGKKRGVIKYFVSDSPEMFKKCGKKFIGKKIFNVNVVKEEVSYVWSKCRRKF